MIPALTLFAALVTSPDVPRLPELQRFPAGDVARANWRACVDHQRWLEPRVGLNADVPEFGWGEYERAVGWAANCWSALDDARRPHCQWDRPGELARRLDRLRDLLGDEAYRAGRMPPVPGK